MIEATWFLVQKAVNISDEVKEGLEEKLYDPSIIPWLWTKQTFSCINITNKHFLNAGIQFPAFDISIMHSDEDADVDIVSIALTVANTWPVTLLGEDTHLLIILLWHHNSSFDHSVHLYLNSSKTTVGINKSKQLLSDELIHSNLAIHTFSCCDTTTRLHSVGSRTVSPNLLRNQEFWNLVSIFLLASDILQSVEKILLLLLENSWWASCT